MSRRRILAVTLLAVIGIAATSAADMPTKLLWNATASAPVGFYTIEPADRIEVPRPNREQALSAYVQHYASRLEHYARRAPYNWFNFYDFWIDDAPPLPDRRTAVAVPADIDTGRRHA